MFNSYYLGKLNINKLFYLYKFLLLRLSKYILIILQIIFMTYIL